MRKLLENKMFLTTSILLVVGVIILIYFGVKKYLDSRDAYSRESRQQFSNTNLSYSNLEFENMAVRILDAMSGALTDEKIIYEILQSLRNKDDWYKLVNVFGVRETTSMWSSWKGNLVEWLIDELDSAEQYRVKEILALINVTF